MVQYFTLLARREGFSAQAFHDHWRHPHGTLARRIPTMRSYVQSHQLHTDLLGAAQAEFDGVAESTYDTVQDLERTGEEPLFKEHVGPDIARFIDLARMASLTTDEEVLVSRAHTPAGANYSDALWLHLNQGTTIKLLQFIQSDGDPAWAGPEDAELGQRLGALRHVRNYPLWQVHGATPPFLGVRQLWWPTLSAFEAGVRQDPAALRQLLAQAGKAVTMLTQAERVLR